MKNTGSFFRLTSVEDLEELHRRVARVLDVMAEAGRNVPYKVNVSGRFDYR